MKQTTSQWNDLGGWPWRMWRSSSSHMSKAQEEVPTTLEHSNHGPRVVGGGTQGPWAETGMDPSATVSRVALISMGSWEGSPAGWVPKSVFQKDDTKGQVDPTSSARHTHEPRRTSRGPYLRSGPIVRLWEDWPWAPSWGLGGPAVGPSWGLRGPAVGLSWGSGRTITGFIMNFQEQRWKIQFLDSLSGKDGGLIWNSCSHFRELWTRDPTPLGSWASSLCAPRLLRESKEARVTSQMLSSWLRLHCLKPGTSATSARCLRLVPWATSRICLPISSAPSWDHSTVRKVEGWLRSFFFLL